MADRGDRLEGQLVTQHDDTKAYRFFRISSNERTTGTPSNFTVSFGNDPRLDRITEVHVIAASIPNVFPNISAAKGNSTFTATATIAGPVSFVVPDGFWTTANLMTYIQAQINAIIAPSTIAVTQDANTQKITFTITGAETMIFGQGTIAQALGILSPSAPLGVYTADVTPNLTGETVFYIHSSELAQNSTYLNQEGGRIIDVNGFLTIPVTVPWKAHQFYQPTENLDRAVYGRSGKSLRGLNITLRGNGGRLLNLPENYEMVIVVKAMFG